MLKVKINSEINEYYIKYHKDENYNYYVWVGSNNWMCPPPRFIWLPHSIKRSIWLTYIPSEQKGNEAPINFD
jgi:hypothetical protein